MEISVIVPVYNKARYIGSVLSDIAKQSVMPSGRTSTRRFPVILPVQKRHAKRWRNL